MREKYSAKRYLHFDRVCSYHNVRSRVEDPKWVAQHGFFPFIYFEKTFDRFIGYDYIDPETKAKMIKTKKRPIMYASHIDSFIYSFYSDIFNDKYNQWSKEHNIDSCATAYRNNKRGKSNIHYAAEVIQFIVNSPGCYIMVGDYHDFFGSLNHGYLKFRLKEVLQKQDLDKDEYAVLKSVMKYAYVDKKGLEKYLRMHGTNIEKLKVYFTTGKEFRLFKDQAKILGLLRKNDENDEKIGIPQGSAISAVLANVYMIKIDEEINRVVRKYNGMYRRYSDDFIVLIPQDDKVDLTIFNLVKNEIKKIIDKGELTLQEQKTKTLVFQDSTIRDVETNKLVSLDYLGFCFDGIDVKVRQKSIYKFYRNAYTLIKKAWKKTREKHCSRLMYRRKIYRLYTYLGKKPHKIKRKNTVYYGNFLSYIERAQKVFQKIDKINCCIPQQVKNCKKKVFNKMHKVQNLLNQNQGI